MKVHKASWLTHAIILIIVTVFISSHSYSTFIIMGLLRVCTKMPGVKLNLKTISCPAEYK